MNHLDIGREWLKDGDCFQLHGQVAEARLSLSAVNRLRVAEALIAGRLTETDDPLIFTVPARVERADELATKRGRKRVRLTELAYASAEGAGRAQTVDPFRWLNLPAA